MMDDSNYQPLHATGYEEEVQPAAVHSASPAAQSSRFPFPASRVSSAARSLSSVAWPLALFLVLTAIMTYPLVLDLGGSVIHGVTADADVSRWDLWWVKTSLLDRHANPFYTDMLYYPYRQTSNPLNLYYHTLQPFNGILALPFLLVSSPVVGPTLGYNVLVLLHFVLTGCAMFWLVRYLTGNSFAGVVSGILFDFSPFHQYHLQYGQLELMPLEWLPLFVLFLHKLLYKPHEQNRLLNGALAFLCLIAATFTSWYLTLYMLIMGGILVAVRAWQLRRDTKALRGALLAAAGVVGMWLVVVSPFLLATLKAAADPSFELVSGLDYEARFSLSPLNLFSVWKDTRFDPAVWNIGSLGYVAMVLGAVGAWRVGKKGIFWFVLIATGVILALGPYLHFGDVSFVSQTTGIPLPYLLLRELPFLSISRVPRRFIVFTNLGLDVLAGFAVVYLLDKARALAPRLRSISPQLVTGGVMGLLVVVPLAELATVPQPAEKVFISPFFSQIAAKSPGEAIMEMPVTSHYLRDHARMLTQTVHGKKIIGGYTARRVTDYYLDRDSPFYTFIEMPTRIKPDIVPPLSAVAVLNYYDMPYLVFYKQDESYEQPTDKPAVEKYVQKIMPQSAIIEDDRQLTAYQVPVLTETVPLIWPGNGWYPPESSGGDVWRWSSGEAHLRIQTRAPMSLHPTFTSSTFRGEGTLTVSVDGKPLKSFHITQAFAELDAGVIDLPAGDHTIVFGSDNKPVTPASVGGAADDQRQLAFVVKNLRLH